jgi:hypothetical protein
VQSRFVQNIGQVMSAVSVAMGVNLVFADYKASQGRATGSKVPDITCMTQNRAVRILGEIKTPWVNQHDLEAAIMIGGARFRRVFGKQKGDICIMIAISSYAKIILQAKSPSTCGLRS